MAKIFHYRGRTNDGNYTTGQLESEKIEDVITYLINRNITPITIEKSHDKIPRHKKLFATALSFSKIKPFHIMNLCRQLATLHNIGLPITKALDRLAKSTDIHELKIALENIANDVAAGMTFSDALGKHPRIFSEIVINMVKIGENTGNLSETLIYLGKHIESSMDNRRRFMGAIRYPMFVIIAALVAMVTMNFLVIPKFADMFSKFNIALPLATRFIIESSNFLIRNQNILILLFIGGFIIIKWALTVPKIKNHWDKHKLRLPIFGNLQRRILVSQFAWSFSLILKAGIPIVKAVGLSSGAINNHHFSSQLLKIKTSIEHGESFSTAATNSNLFAPIVLQMIEVGEEGQSLDNTLTEIARHYDAEVDYELNRINKSLEPMLLIILGGVVLILALGIYFPMWDLIKMAQF